MTGNSAGSFSAHPTGTETQLNLSDFQLITKALRRNLFVGANSTLTNPYIPSNTHFNAQTQHTPSRWLC